MEENKKNKRKSIAEWIAVILCIAAAPVPCITLMSATKVLTERWECIALWPALLCLVIGAIAFFITCSVCTSAMLCLPYCHIYRQSSSGSSRKWRLKPAS